jgi:hypothetical protein
MHELSPKPHYLEINISIMKTILITIISLLILNLPITLLSQNCNDKNIHSGLCKEPFDIDYEDTGKSMSFPMMVGKTQKLVMTLPGKKDYYFAVCSENGTALKFKIKSAVNQNEVIFDNTKDFDEPQSIEFSMLFTNKILFEITLPAIFGSDTDKKPVCIGMLIYYKDN